VNTDEPGKHPESPHGSSSDLSEAEGAPGNLKRTKAGHEGAARPASGQPSDRRRVDPERLKNPQQRDADGSFQALRELACTLATELDLRGLASRILQSALRAFGVGRGVLFLGQGDERGLVPAVVLNVKGEELEAIELVSRTILNKAQQNDVLVTRDASRDPRLQDVARNIADPMCAVLCAPLIGRAGRTGVIYLDAPNANTVPADAERLLGAFAELAAVSLENARIHGEVLKENARIRHRQPPEESLVRLIGSSPPMWSLRHRALMAAQMDSPMLFVGEEGTGKELLARAIHDLSIRGHHPFVAVDCSAAAPEELQGLILGRVGPAAMKSYSEEIGVLALADHGTLFLNHAEYIGPEFGDEIAEMLREGQYRQMGSRRDLRLDIRLVLATARNLREAVLDGTFSEALYNKVNTLALRVPPMRERMSDLPELVAHFVGLYRDGRRHAQAAFTTEAIRALEDEAWPGNVEELERVVHRALLTTRKNVVTAAQVRHCLLPSEEHEALRYGPWTGRVLPLTAWEKEAIRQALTHTRGNRSEAARLLGVHRNTLVRKVREHALE
jgi:two-component system, NtrC family, response regulator HydG